METLKKIVSNQYFPAAAVLTAVVLFWAVGLLGGLSLLHNNQPPLTTLTWMLFVYTAAVLTPLAGILAGADLLRRWRRNRAAAASADTAERDPDTELAGYDAEPAAHGTEPDSTEAGSEALGGQPPEAYVPADHFEPQLQQEPAEQKPSQKKPGANKAA